MSENIFWSEGYVTRGDRCQINKHKSGLIWFTGLPASGKSTIACNTEKVLFDKGIRAYVLDGDNVRHGLSADLGFSKDDRRENIRRIAEVSLLMADAGLIVLAAFISPYLKDREYVRRRFGTQSFFEVYLKCSLAECERRDPKGLYGKARRGLIQEYTGVSAPYEAPEYPDLVINTEVVDIAGSVRRVVDLLCERGLVEK